MSEITVIPNEVTEVETQNEITNTTKDAIPGYITESFLLADTASHNAMDVLLNERCLVMPETVIFGCLIQELIDSFLVALPMVIQVNMEGDSRGKLTPKTRIARFFKSQIESIILPNDQQKYFYRKALLDYKDIAGDFLNPGKLEYIKNFIKDFEGNHPEKTLFKIEEELELTDDSDSVTFNWDMPNNVSDKAFQSIWFKTTKH